MTRRAVNTRFAESEWKEFVQACKTENTTYSEFVRLSVKRALKAVRNGEQINPARSVGE